MIASPTITQTQNKPFGIILEAKDDTHDINALDVSKLRHLFDQHHLLVLRGFKPIPSCETLSSYCKRWGELSIWPFGTVLELIQQNNPQDHIFDNSYVPLHWDGMYRPQVPEVQIFQCVKAPNANQGGQTVFVHTPSAIAAMSNELATTCRNINASYRRKMEFYNSQVQSKLIVKHPYKDYEVIRYNEPHTADNGPLINHPNINFHGISHDKANIVHQQLKQLLYAAQHSYAHNWHDNDIVIADNFTLLHGRRAFASLAPRHLRRVQIHSTPAYENTKLTSYA